MRSDDVPSDNGAGSASSRVVLAATSAGAMVLFASLGWGVFEAASRIDATSMAREERLLVNGVQLHAEETCRSLAPNTIWDDAVAHLDQRFDPNWARDYIGQYFWRTNGYQHVYVLDALGRPLFAYERGRVVDPGTFAPLETAAAPLIAEIRNREAARGPYRPGDMAAPAPITVGAVAGRSGTALVLAASLVQSDRSSGARPSSQAPIVMVGEDIDRDFISKFNRRHLLTDLRVAPLAGAAPAGYATLALKDAAGRNATRLAWRPNRPAADLLGIAGPTLAIAFLTLALMATILVRHERRRSQALIAAMREARSASEAKSTFLATMSHEIRTPLNGVLGMTQAMAMEPLSRRQRASLDVVHQSGEALLAILNNVLDLAKIEAGKLELEVIDFDLSDLMQAAHAAFTVLANKKGLSFCLDISGAEGVYRGDPTRIRQILYNLISNALKFTASGEIQVRAQVANETLKISVADTGEGIAQDKLALLFGQFTQADASTTRRFGGTGLGLSICRELSVMMGGSIEATSTLGEGSEFTVTLNVQMIGAPRAGHALPSPNAAPRALNAHSLRVLVAEDNQVNQLVVKTLLHHAGIDPTVVDNGALAVQSWVARDWDLILMDIQMPVLDGLEATRRIREHERETGRARTPIIALTANAMNHQIAEYRQVGMDGHIAKPIEARALFEVLANMAPAADEDEAFLDPSGWQASVA
jgi:signal transduction histidine kinase/CheY-like chemotaxis protein